MKHSYVYLDNNATTQPLPEVMQAVQHAMQEYWGNPSSIHRIGQAARQQMDLARETIAALIHATPADITFTSGGTEAANLAILSACKMHPDRTLIVTSQIEHAAVGEMVDQLEHDGMEIVRLENDNQGVISMTHLKTLLQERASEIAVVSLMWCNNETGVIEPIEEACALCRAHEVVMHSDATQWVGKVPVDVTSTPIDFLTFAAHKFHGPKGIGALYARKGIVIAPLVTGGPQERGRRGGTENVPSILGFAVAAQAAMDWMTPENIERMEWLRDDFESLVMEKIPQAHINSNGALRAWTTSSISIPSVKGELILLMLSERKVCVSSGSACSSGAFTISKVIEAIGLPNKGEWGTIRFSFARTTTKEELERTVDALCDVLSKIKEIVQAGITKL